MDSAVMTVVDHREHLLSWIEVDRNTVSVIFVSAW